jgi:hypothetical protein
MSDSIDLVLGEETYTVPRKWVHKLLSDQVDADSLARYDVQARVPGTLFEEFLDWLAIDATPQVTRANARGMRFLASEFRLPELEERCDVAIAAQMAAPLPVSIGIAAELQNPEVEARALHSERRRMLMMAERCVMKEKIEMACGRTPTPWHLDPICQSWCPRRPTLYPSGFIMHLTMANSGNLHRMAIVTVTSSSVCEDNPKWAPENTLQFDGLRSFRSRDFPYQWICWTFHYRQVLVTEYTIISNGLRSWSLEGSLNGRYWTVIDRRTDTEEFKGGTLRTASFGVAAEVQCRHIRLVQTGPTHRARARNCLSLAAVEFFGTLFEAQYL